MDILALERWRLEALDSLPTEVIDALPVHRCLIAVDAEEPRLILDFGHDTRSGRWVLRDSSLPLPERLDIGRAKLDALHAVQLLVDAGLPLSQIRLTTGLPPKASKGDLRWVGKHPGLASVPRLSLRMVPLAGRTDVVVPGLTNAERVDLSGTRADLSGLASTEWPSLQYIGLGQTSGDTEALLDALRTMPSLRGASLPTCALAGSDRLAEHVKGWDFLELAVDDNAEALDLIPNSGLLGRELRHLSFTGYARGAQSIANVLATDALGDLVTLKLGYVDDNALPVPIALPRLRALSVSALSSAVLRWLSEQPWLDQLRVLELEVGADADGALAHLLDRLFSGQLEVLRLSGPPTSPAFRDVLADARSERLRAVELRRFEVGAADLAAMNERFPELSGLSVNTNAPLGGDGVVALAGFGERLHHFGWTSKIAGDALGSVLALPLMRCLRELDLTGAAIGTKECETLAAPTMPNIVTMHLRSARPSPEAVAALYEGKDKPHLAWLSGLHKEPPPSAHRLRTCRPQTKAVLDWGPTAMLSSPFA